MSMRFRFRDNLDALIKRCTESSTFPSDSTRAFNISFWETDSQSFGNKLATMATRVSVSFMTDLETHVRDFYHHFLEPPKKEIYIVE